MRPLTPGRLARRAGAGLTLALAALKAGGGLAWPWWAVSLPTALPYAHVAAVLAVLTLYSLPYAAVALCTKNWRPTPARRNPTAGQTAPGAPHAADRRRRDWRARRLSARASRQAADTAWQRARAELRQAEAEAKARLRTERRTDPAEAYRTYYLERARLRAARSRAVEADRRARLHTPDNPDGQETTASQLWLLADWPWDCLAEAWGRVQDDATTDRAEVKRQAIASLTRRPPPDGGSPAEDPPTPDSAALTSPARRSPEQTPSGKTTNEKPPP